MAARSRQKPTFRLCGAAVKKLGLRAGNMSIETVIPVVLGGLLCECIDASMGMLYGTILSPVLIIAGFEPALVVPSILLSQALGGLTASIFHHKFGNVNLALKTLNPKIIVRKLSELGYIKSCTKQINQSAIEQDLISPTQPLFTDETQAVSLLKFQRTHPWFSPIEHLCRQRDTKTLNSSIHPMNGSKYRKSRPIRELEP
jgi:hypothetical protein